MTLNVITPESTLFEGEAAGVQLPGIEGSFEVLDHHAPIISALKEGDVRINKADGDMQLTITRGFVECVNNQVNVMIESGELI